MENLDAYLTVPEQNKPAADEMDLFAYVFAQIKEQNAPVLYGFSEFMDLWEHNLILPNVSILEITLEGEDADLVLMCTVTKGGLLKDLKTKRYFAPQDLLDDGQYQNHWRLMNLNMEPYRFIN
jgi:hypothetical protein